MPDDKLLAISTNYGALTFIENRCSSGKLSDTGFGSPGECSLDRKSATWLSLPGRSCTLMLNACINNSHLVIVPFVINLFIKYFMVEWSVWI